MIQHVWLLMPLCVNVEKLLQIENVQPTQMILLTNFQSVKAKDFQCLIKGGTLTKNAKNKESGC